MLNRDRIRTEPRLGAALDSEFRLREERTDLLLQLRLTDLRIQLRQHIIGALDSSVSRKTLPVARHGHIPPQ